MAKIKIDLDRVIIERTTPEKLARVFYVFDSVHLRNLLSKGRRSPDLIMYFKNIPSSVVEGYEHEEEDIHDIHDDDFHWNP